MKRTLSSATPLAQTIALALLAALAAGCATKPDIRLDHDAAADFRAYRTFAFYDNDHPAGAATPRYTTLLDARLRQATRAQMEKHEYAYSEVDPDLRVNVRLQVVERQELRSTPGARPYRGWSGIETVDYRKGTLAIDVVDAHRHALVWRGIAEGRLDDKAMAQPGPAVDSVVNELFAAFPGERPN